jgi:hypothetical protein
MNALTVTGSGEGNPKKKKFFFLPKTMDEESSLQTGEERILSLNEDDGKKEEREGETKFNAEQSMEMVTMRAEKKKVEIDEDEDEEIDYLREDNWRLQDKHVFVMSNSGR